MINTIFRSKVTQFAEADDVLITSRRHKSALLQVGTESICIGLINIIKRVFFPAIPIHVFAERLPTFNSSLAVNLIVAMSNDS